MTVLQINDPEAVAIRQFLMDAGNFPPPACASQ
jgi:hypothetical protein